MKFLWLSLLFLLIVSTAFAEDYVVVNSLDGRDVVSAANYAAIKGLPIKLVASGVNEKTLAAIVGSDHEILLIQSQFPANSFIESTLTTTSKKIDKYVATSAETTNLDLAIKSGAKKFIIVDSSYSDYALSALPYAVRSKSYIIFANKDLAQKIKPIVSSSEVIVFGAVDKEVYDILPSAQIQIGKGEDKFEDNVLIVQKFMDSYNSSSAIFTDGSFIEESMILGQMPLLLSGKLVPSSTYAFVKSKVSSGQLKQLMLLSNEFISPSYDLRNRLSNDLGLNASKTLSIILKFGQVVTSESGSAPGGLSIIPVPAYKPKLEIGTPVYNSQTKTIDVGIKNIGDGPAFYVLETRVKANGNEIKVFTDSSAIRLERSESKPIQYSFVPPSDFDGDLFAATILKFGSSKNSLEEVLVNEGKLISVSYLEEANITILGAKYDSTKKSFLVTIKNNKPTKVYEFSRISLLLGGSLTNISATSDRVIEPNSVIIEEFPIELSQTDLSANKDLGIYVSYGSREGLLVKNLFMSIPLVGAGFDFNLIILAILVLIIIAAILFKLKRK